MSQHFANLSPFGTLLPQPADALLALIGLYRSDPRPSKIDLGVGVYRDADGATPIMRAVKAAEERLLGLQKSKSYLGAEGDLDFVTSLAGLAFGPELLMRDTLAGTQTPGGTGALRLGAELYARARPEARIWVGTPTWPNHVPIFAAAGLRVTTHPFYKPQDAVLDFAGMVAALGTASPHDLVLVHGCCHNPTGVQFTTGQWDVLAELCLARGLTPFVDFAYQGLGDGWDEDADGVRRLLARIPTALIAYSCDKNFGLYRDRVGALWVHETATSRREPIWQNMLVMARSLWSMPPDHGAAAVRTVIQDPALLTEWNAELDEMRLRLNAVRHALAIAHPALQSIGNQRGMFGLLRVSPDDVDALRETKGIYMAASGRINIAGLTLQTVERFVSAVAPFLPKT